jgi:aryl carrier-like protein
MPFESWQSAINPKVRGTWNLHTQLPQQGLDFFLMLSSITGVLGSAGQANYAAGNSYLDALARFRVAHGQPAVALDLGVMKGDGFLAENKEFLQRWIGPGYFIQVSPGQLLALLDHYCTKIDFKTDVAQNYNSSQMVIGVDIPANLKARGIEDPWWMRQPLLCHLYQIAVTYDADSGNNAEASSSESATVDVLLACAQSLEAAGTIVARMLLRKLSRAFSIPEEQMDVTESLHVHGVDSLVAVELRNWFAKEFGVDVPIFDLLSGVTFAAVGLMVASRSPFCQGIRDRETETSRK